MLWVKLTFSNGNMMTKQEVGINLNPARPHLEYLQAWQMSCQWTQWNMCLEWRNKSIQGLTKKCRRSSMCMGHSVKCYTEIQKHYNQKNGHPALLSHFLVQQFVLSLSQREVTMCVNKAKPPENLEAWIHNMLSDSISAFLNASPPNLNNFDCWFQPSAAWL